jgi:hypothetical protein
MTSNGVSISHLGDPPTAGHHRSHGLYPERDSWWILVGNKGMTGVLRMLDNADVERLSKLSSPRDRRRPICAESGCIPAMNSPTWNRLS